LIDQKACKHLWKCAVEYHAFFRLRSAPKQVTSGISGFIRRGSRFRGPQRTEFQTTNLSVSTRRSVQFERRPSQRFSRRASYAIKRKLQEQLKVRDQNQQVPTLSTIVSVNDVTEASKASAAATVPLPNKESQQKVSVNLIDIDNFPIQTSPQGATCVVSSTIKEEAENAQARLKQIEIESIQIIEKPIKQQPPPVPARQQQQQQRHSTHQQHSPSIINSEPPPLPPLPSNITQNYGNCCKLQQSRGGAEHDTKCNLLKAQQIKTTEQPSSVCSAPNECSSSVEHKKSSCGCETCNKEVKSKIDFEEEKIEDNNNNNQFIDKNEQQNDDRVKLIDKELISSITTTKSKS
jgi:hypothetical protein